MEFDKDTVLSQPGRHKLAGTRIGKHCIYTIVTILVMLYRINIYYVYLLLNKGEVVKILNYWVKIGCSIGNS